MSIINMMPTGLIASVGSGKRNIVAAFCRGPKKHITMVRRYARLTTAMPRALTLILQYGEPGDVIEFYRADTGMWIGYVRVAVGGKLSGAFLPGEVE